MSGPIDRHTVDQLVVESLPAAWRVARRLTNDADAAEEIVQEALCRVLERWKSFRREASFQTWMIQIVVNVYRDSWRQRHKLVAASESTHYSRIATPNEHAEAAELAERIREAINGLPERQREVALLAFGEGLTAKEVAQVLEVSEANVHTCLHLARRRIAAELGLCYGN